MAYIINIDKCTGCGLCLDECPVQAIQKDDDIYVIAPDICTECGYCSDICPEDAIFGEEVG